MSPGLSPNRVLALLVVFYSVGLAGHLVPLTLPWMLVLTPWFLLGAGAVLLLSCLGTVRPQVLLLWLIPTLLVTFGLEALGVATGWVFGPYHYTGTLGFLVLGVPPVIGWNWVLVVLGVHSAVLTLLPRVPEGGRIVLVGLACVAFDLLLEPVAIALGYWVWHGGTVPLQNYLAWGLIAAGGSWWAGRFPSLPAAPALGGYVLLQAVFFFALGWAGVRV